jgi:ElaB/YqjD/DUF883 family membrane-anchored ribosome-binding protein
LAIRSKPFRASWTAGAQPAAPSNADNEGDERRPRLRNPTSLPSLRGRKGVAAVKQQIEERPFISLLVAFGIGLVIGKLINR